MNSWFAGLFGVVEYEVGGEGDPSPFAVLLTVLLLSLSFPQRVQTTLSQVSVPLPFEYCGWYCFCGSPFPSVTYIAKMRKPEAGWWGLHKALASLCMNKIVWELVTILVIS